MARKTPIVPVFAQPLASDFCLYQWNFCGAISWSGDLGKNLGKKPWGLFWRGSREAKALEAICRTSCAVARLN